MLVESILSKMISLVMVVVSVCLNSLRSVHKDFVPVIRYSEVLLNLAEAKARLAGTAVDASALALLNAVRSRSTTAYAAADIATGTALVRQS
jgi:hypothetical protein